MPTVVIGTAGHIDHGKTALLRALTGIDADRLPEERARGMTIDVGFAHLDLDDGTSLDFVDVPGHDRLVGNMLVGAGEIDAALLVVAADDGPRAQTLEHLELLSALGLRHGAVAITKADVAAAPRVAEVMAATRSLVDRTSLAGAPIVEVSAQTGVGLAQLRLALVALRDAVLADQAGRPSGPPRLPIDRAFAVRGRGSVVTGTLRGGSVSAGLALRLEPGGAAVRVREVQVHHGRTDIATGGRAALNLAGVEPEDLRRGSVLTAGPGIEASDRVLIALAPPIALGEAGPAIPGPRAARPPGASTAAQLHLWTETVEASVRPTGSAWIAVGDGRIAAILRLARPVAVMAGLRGVLRDPGSGRVIGGVTLLDPRPPRGVSRRRVTAGRLGALAAALDRLDGAAAVEALVDVHGAITSDRVEAMAAATGSSGVVLAAGTPGVVLTAGSPGVAPGPSAAVPRRSAAGPPWALRLSADVTTAMTGAVLELAGEAPTLTQLRLALVARLRRIATIERGWSAMAAAAADRVVADLVAAGRLVRDGDHIRLGPGAGDGSAGGDGSAATSAAASAVASAAARAAALDRLEAALDADVPPSLAEAARAAGCPPDGIVVLERSGRIVRVEDDLAWSAPRYASLRDRALELARRGPLAPAAFRDEIGGNRRIALAFLEDLGRKGVLRRTDAGHVPGPRAT